MEEESDWSDDFDVADDNLREANLVAQVSDPESHFFRPGSGSESVRKRRIGICYFLSLNPDP